LDVWNYYDENARNNTYKKLKENLNQIIQSCAITKFHLQSADFPETWQRLFVLILLMSGLKSVPPHDKCISVNCGISVKKDEEGRRTRRRRQELVFQARTNETSEDCHKNHLFLAATQHCSVDTSFKQLSLLLP
jgi:hypothetical protein